MGHASRKSEKVEKSVVCVSIKGSWGKLNIYAWFQFRWIGGKFDVYGHINNVCAVVKVMYVKEYERICR
jgi:hypothetical protein